MQHKHSRITFIRKEKQLLMVCKKEFKDIYKYFSDDPSFSEPCVRELLKQESAVPDPLLTEFIEYCESIRAALNEQVITRNKSLTKIENLLAQIRFLKLRFLIH